MRYRVELEDKDYGWDYVIVDAESEDEVRYLYDNEVIIAIIEMDV